MDLLPSVDQLRDHLVAHDRAVREIIALDQYIEQISQQTFLSSMGECMHATFKNMIRISIAEGLKRMYKEYRLHKWLKVQAMANTVRRVLEGEVLRNQHLPELQQAEGQQVHQGQLVQMNHQFPQQQQNMNMEMYMPSAPTWHPANMFQQVSSPIPVPLQMISPIHTPSRTGNMQDLVPRRQLTGATPEDFHQFVITNISASENPLSSRRLFPEELADDIVNQSVNDSKDFAQSSDSDSGHGDEEDNYLSDQSVQESNYMYAVPSVGENVETELVMNQHVIQPVFNPTIPQQEADAPELLDDSDVMDWDNDEEEEESYEYNSSEDSLAGVLFAAEHLLPEEQAVRLDVEMGDMGVGHMVFDRVSATWYTAQCEFYRAS